MLAALIVMASIGGASLYAAFACRRSLGASLSNICIACSAYTVGLPIGLLALGVH